jgi:hypothetical protein
LKDFPLNFVYLQNLKESTLARHQWKHEKRWYSIDGGSNGGGDNSVYDDDDGDDLI